MIIAEIPARKEEAAVSAASRLRGEEGGCSPYTPQ
jgi:hypothetical protein